MQRYIILILLVLFSASVSAQNKTRISGVITDSATKAPLPFATVRVISPKNPAQPVRTGFTKEDGSFAFTGMDTGRYMVVVTHTSYQEKKQRIVIKAIGENVTVPPIMLNAATADLKDVTVVKQRPLVEQADDKIIFNVEDDPASKSETAIDILRKTPFITVDGDDNVQINGKSNFKVLLNGRETSMFAKNLKEALRGFPGALISKIEVITSPSAKYDAEGIGGIINIITKKKVVGYNGSVNTFSRTTDKRNHIAVNGNAKFGKTGFSLFFLTGENAPVDWDVFNTTIPTNPSAFSKRSMTGIQANSGTRSFGNGEFSFELDSLTIISAYGNVNSFHTKTVSSQAFTTDFTSAPSSQSFFNMNNNNNSPGYSVGTDLIRKGKTNKEREMSIRLFGEFGRTEAYMNSFQDNPGTDRYIINNSLSKNNQYTIQADQVLPIKKGGKLEGGLKAVLRRASSDFSSMLKYNASESFKSNPSNSDYFSYNQDVWSVYSMYSFKVGKSTLRFGARVENTNVNGDFVTSNTKVKQDYTTLLPNVQVTRKLSKLITMVAGYSKRIARPFIQDLNPFVFNNDSLNITSGNPNLDPQTIHALKLQTSIFKGVTFAAINLEGSYSGNKILDYSSFDPSTGVTKTTSLNIGKEYQVNLFLNFNTRFTKNWTFNTHSALRYAKVTNNAKASQSNQGFGGSMGMNTNYNITKRFSVGGLFVFWQDPVTIQTTYPFSYWYNMSFGYKFFKNKLNVSLRALNVFEKTFDFTTTTRDPNFTTDNTNRQIRRGVALALSWNFGKLTESVSKKKGVVNDDQVIKNQPTQQGQ